MICRPMQKCHIPHVAALERECFGEPWSEGSLALLCTEAASGFVSVDKEEHVLGYIGVLWALDEGQITNLAVTASHRRSGIGRSLIRCLLETARMRGCRQLSLEVRASNESAIRLYLAEGFYEAGRRRRFYRTPAEDAVVMLCSLAAEASTENENTLR